MNRIDYYYSGLYKEAKRFERYRQYFLYAFLLFVCFSFFSEGSYLIIFSFVALIFQAIIWVLSNKKKESIQNAHNLQRISMLQTIYKTNSFKFETSQIIGKISNWVHNWVKENMEQTDSANYHNPDNINSSKKLLFRIEENAFWNYHLFSVSFKQAIAKLSVLLVLVIMIVFISFPFITVRYEAIFIVKIVLLVFSSIQIWDEIEKISDWKDAAEIMLAIDNRVNNDINSQEDFILYIFSNYNIAKSNAPLIPDNVYKRERDKLNNAWSKRIQNYHE